MGDRTHRAIRVLPQHRQLRVQRQHLHAFEIDPAGSFLFTLTRPHRPELDEGAGLARRVDAVRGIAEPLADT
jgi:hypothetical protein